MERRSFLECLCLALFVPKKAEAKTVEIPFLPTLRFLQEYNKNITVFIAEYSTRGTWTGLVHRTDKSKLMKDHIAKLHWENGEWFAVDKQWREESGKLCYFNKIPWPNWLRKF